MSFGPVTVRELQAQARQPLTYWLRVLGGVSIAIAFAISLWQVRQLQEASASGAHAVLTFGMTLFGKLNLCIHVAIWVLVPIATADAISRERREGTLPLLYLTKLSSWGIVLGKTSAHVLRAISLFLTMVPWLLLPVLFGGVELRDVTMAILINSIALLLALAAGLVASSMPRDWLKAVILAQLLALLLFIGMLRGHERVIVSAIRSTVAPLATGQVNVAAGNVRLNNLISSLEYSRGFLQRTLRRLEFATNSSIDVTYGLFAGRNAQLETRWQLLWANLPPTGHMALFRGVAAMWLQALLVLFLSVAGAAWCIQRSWRDAEPSIRFQKLKQTLLSPRFRVDLLRTRLSRSLSTNPIGWLQHHSAPARLVKWGWCFLILAAEIGFSANPADLYDAQLGLGLLLLLGIAFTSTASFRNELQTGAFELLLVTPLRERQIILGRLRGLWHQFFPALLIYGGGSIYLASGWAAADHLSGALLALAGVGLGFVVLPVVGLYLSLHRLNLLVAWLCTCAAALVPAVVMRALGIDYWLIGLVELTIACAAAYLLKRRLQRRRFAFQ